MIDSRLTATIIMVILFSVILIIVSLFDFQRCWFITLFGIVNIIFHYNWLDRRLKPHYYGVVK